jgi:hypothetical protein
VVPRTGFGGRGWQNGAVENRRFLDPSQPQTLQGAVMLSYINALFALIGLIFGSGIIAIGLLEGVGAYAIANEKRWGYRLNVVVSILFLLATIAQFVYSLSFAALIPLGFAIVLVALLLHPMSREYQRIWFR